MIAIGACLSLACIHEHLPDIDLTPTVFEGFAGTTKTTEELHELADLYLPVVLSLLWYVWFNPLPYVLGLTCTE